MVGGGALDAEGREELHAGGVRVGTAPTAGGTGGQKRGGEWRAGRKGHHEGGEGGAAGEVAPLSTKKVRWGYREDKIGGIICRK